MQNWNLPGCPGRPYVVGAEGVATRALCLVTLLWETNWNLQGSATAFPWGGSLKGAAMQVQVPYKRKWITALSNRESPMV